MPFLLFESIKLSDDITTVDATIIGEHKSWLEKNIPSYISVDGIGDTEYGFLNYPKLWSGSRFFGAKIETESTGKKHAFKVISRLISIAKQEDSSRKDELKKFKKKYKNYITTLKERYLLLAIKATLDSIENPPDSGDVCEKIKKDFLEILSPSSLISMQTRFECLQAHKDVTLKCDELRNITDSDSKFQDKINQLEVLTKSFLDHHYDSVKKFKTFDIIIKNITTITSFFGLIASVTACVLGFLGFFFPPLIPFSVIIGFIGFISYLSSVATIGKIAHEAIGYRRSPESSDVKVVVITILLAPLYVVGNLVLEKLLQWVTGDGVKLILGKIEAVWNNMLCYIFPDIFTAEETITDTINCPTAFTANGQLKNTTTATSWKKIRSAMAANDEETTDKILQTKNNMKENSTPNTVAHGRDFAFVNLTKEDTPRLKTVKSYHGHIFLWDHGFRGLGTSKEAQFIKDEHEKYKLLKPDDPILTRIEHLNSIQEKCKDYINHQKDMTKGRYNYVLTLYENVENELKTLLNLVNTNDHESSVLVGFKTE